MYLLAMEFFDFWDVGVSHEGVGETDLDTGEACLDTGTATSSFLTVETVTWLSFDPFSVAGLFVSLGDSILVRFSEHFSTSISHFWEFAPAPGTSTLESLLSITIGSSFTSSISFCTSSSISGGMSSACCKRDAGVVFSLALNSELSSNTSAYSKFDESSSIVAASIVCFSSGCSTVSSLTAGRFSFIADSVALSFVCRSVASSAAFCSDAFLELRRIFTFDC